MLEALNSYGGHTPATTRTTATARSLCVGCGATPTLNSGRGVTWERIFPAIRALTSPPTKTSPGKEIGKLYLVLWLSTPMNNSPPKVFANAATVSESSVGSLSL